MGEADGFPGQMSDRTRVRPARRRARSAGTGRIRYAHGGVTRVEPFCTVAQGTGGHYGVISRDGAADPSELGFAWSAEFPVAGRRHDLWVLVCGGIAAAAAFAAAFVASGGVASHPATPSAVPASISRACPSPIPGAAP
ncbi:MAG TPA: hypothetical protein VN714_19930 [Trebonia sp.]|jgi:hypothetical protein|nr:hypothetical protein [Trebonia sp.]